MESSRIISILIVFLIILFSMVLHEIAHGLVAYWLGDKTAKEQGRLKFNPLMHLDWMNSVILPLMLYILRLPVIGGAKPVPVNRERLKWGPYGMALVALAGPMMNFLIAIVCFAWVGQLIKSGVPAENGAFLAQNLMNAVYINLGFMVFNLIPMPPLDGSRVLYAIAPDGVREALDRIEKYGMGLVFFMVMMLSGPMSRMIGDVIQRIVELLTNIFL